MKTSLWSAALASEQLFSIQDFTVQLCCSEESKSIAYSLRYKAYCHANPKLKDSVDYRVDDNYDAQANTRTHLVWHTGYPIASVRSVVWSAKYQWENIEGIQLFKTDIDRHIRLGHNILESSRYVVDPNINSRVSLTAQLLMFRVQDLSAQVDQCPYIINVVRPKHVSFYQRMLGFRKISDPIKHKLADGDVVLLYTTQTESRDIVTTKGMPPCESGEVAQYRDLLNQHLVP